jgi:hypothetical protein
VYVLDCNTYVNSIQCSDVIRWWWPEDGWDYESRNTSTENWINIRHCSVYTVCNVISKNEWCSKKLKLNVIDPHFQQKESDIETLHILNGEKPSIFSVSSGRFQPRESTSYQQSVFKSFNSPLPPSYVCCNTAADSTGGNSSSPYHLLLW